MPRFPLVALVLLFLTVTCLVTAQEEEADPVPLGGMPVDNPPSEGPPTEWTAAEFVENRISLAPVMMFAKSYCGYCRAAKRIFQDYEIGYDEAPINLMGAERGTDIQAALYALTSQRTVPNIFINGQHIGGYDDLVALVENGELFTMLDAASISYVIPTA
jgi:glutaredoxin 3